MSHGRSHLLDLALILRLNWHVFDLATLILEVLLKNWSHGNTLLQSLEISWDLVLRSKQLDRADMLLVVEHLLLIGSLIFLLLLLRLLDWLCFH